MEDLEEGFAKISRPPAAAASRNEERREREVAATTTTTTMGEGEEKIEGRRTIEGARRGREVTKVEEEA